MGALAVDERPQIVSFYRPANRLILHVLSKEDIVGRSLNTVTFQRHGICDLGWLTFFSQKRDSAKSNDSLIIQFDKKDSQV